LAKRGGIVWIDRSQLTVGDQIRQEIDRAVVGSRFGVVILSPIYVAKRWTNWELDAFFAREGASGSKHVLPVRHGLTSDEVASTFPLVATRLSISTDIGFSAVAEALLRARDETT
jgi:TIR domain